MRLLYRFRLPTPGLDSEPGCVGGKIQFIAALIK